METIFFGYPAKPTSVAEPIRETAKRITQQGDFHATTWEDLQVDGRIIMHQVLGAIDDSSMCVFDLTKLSDNVLFEAGYAIARGKRVWLTLDSTRQRSRAGLREFGMLESVGHAPYRNSAEMLAGLVAFATEPDGSSLYDDIIEPTLPELSTKEALLYCSTFEPFEASNRLSSYLRDRQKKGLALIVSDPAESGLEPITWFAPQIAKSAGVIAHFAGPGRNLAKVHNRRHAFVAGLACGLEVPTLMIAEAEYEVPFDYQDLLVKYESAQGCVGVVRNWLKELQFETPGWTMPRRAELRSTLAGFRLGEHVAENELLELGDYFVETAAFHDVVGARDTIYIGQRGTGKTANATQAFERISADRRNMAVLIKPPSFEFAALFAVIAQLPTLQHDYFFETLWKFVIQTELAASVLAEIETKASGVPRTDAERKFLSFASNAPFDMRADMSLRVGQALDYLLDHFDLTEPSIGGHRNLINEALHSTALESLRHELGPILKSKERVAIFVDNLDKGWERGADFRLIARLILGLLTARGRLVKDFQRQDYWRDRIKLTVATFLRSDIYNYLVREAREPDKIATSSISWRDPQTLLSVIENRFMASSTKIGDASEIWSSYFCATVEGVQTADFILSVVLPRPRDIIYFCNIAISTAVDRRHNMVTGEDFQTAEARYSQNAYEALLVENGVTVPEIRTALYVFLGANSILTRKAAGQLLASEPAIEDRVEEIIDKLIASSFFGIETRAGQFDYPEAGAPMERASALAQRHNPNPAEQRLQIHRAFHAWFDLSVSHQ